MPRYTDPNTGKSFFSEIPLGESQIKEGLGLIKTNIKEPVPEQQLKTSYKEIPQAIGENLVSMATQTAALPFMIPQIVKSTYQKYAPTSIPPKKGITEKMADIGKTIALEPETETGKKAYKLMGLPFEYLGKLAGGVGEVTKSVTGSPVAATTAELGIQALPAILPFGRKAVEKLGIPEKMYTSAIKPGIRKKLSITKREAAMEAGIKEGILPTTGGLDKLGGKIDVIENQIDSVLQRGINSGTPIKTLDIADSLDTLIDAYHKSGMPPESYQGIENVRNKVLAQGNYMTPQEAQVFKQNTYKFIRKHYGELSNATIEAQKTVARTVKDKIAKQYPEVDILNKKVGPMIQLEDEIQRAVKRIQNRDLIGIGLPIKTMAGRALRVAGGAGAGYAVGEPVTGAIMGLAIGILDTPKVKSALAIALDRAHKIAPKIEKGVIAGMLPYGFKEDKKEK